MRNEIANDSAINTNPETIIRTENNFDEPSSIPTATWGEMLNQGRAFVFSAWWLAVFPGLSIFVTVLAVNMLGDGLRDTLDPRLRI